jgi:hypothetical protein
MTVPGVTSYRNPGPYPDTEEALMDLIVFWYPELATDPADASLFHVGANWPDVPDILAMLPLVRVRNIGGNDDRITDHPLIDVDVLHLTFNQARDLARGIQGRLLGYPHRVGSVVIDKVRTAMRPHDVPWDDDRVSRFYASYQLDARR